MDEALNKNMLSNNIQKMYARTQDVNNQCPLDVAVISQAQRNELQICTLDLKRKVRDNKKYLRTGTHFYQIGGTILYVNLGHINIIGDIMTE